MSDGNNIDQSDYKPNNIVPPVLILIRGLPGSGKSFIANALRQTIGDDQAVVLDPDNTDYASQEYSDFSEDLSLQGVDQKFHPYRFLRAQAYSAIISKKYIIWNQAFTNLDGFTKTINNLESFATENNTYLKTFVVEVEVDPETAKQRISKREQSGGHGVPDSEFTRFTTDYKSFSDQGFNLIRVSGTDNVSESVTTILEKIAKN